MHITATRIADWAKTKEAQALLPRLVRRLVHAGGILTQAAFPSGDSTGLPGWDGELKSDHSTAWIPKGKSFWEFSCEANVTAKANEDYKKRTKQTSKKVRDKNTLIVVTGRRWPQKAKWLQAKHRAKQWRKILAYDADDLEQWLEQTPAIALWFAEELGIHGPGVESIEKHWRDWAEQSDPFITREALFADRQDTRDQFLEEVQRCLDINQPRPFIVKADSIEEASAFACAALLTHAQCSVTSLVVTQPDGWGYVDQNPALKVVMAAGPEVAQKPARRNGLIVIIPHLIGGTSSSLHGMEGKDSGANFSIERPAIYEFEKALSLTGLDEAESKRLAVSTGRSWSVFRRHRAVNPAIRKPLWLDMPQASALSTLCLLGGWSAEKSADREVVAQLSGRPYEEIDRDLRHLALVNDAPVLTIGRIWKAKSPLELLDLFGGRITSDELDRFFQMAQTILATPDPQLDLPDKDRHAAQIYGKVRAESALLIETLCDTLVKLAVRGPDVPALAAANIEGHVSTLVRDLLYEADGIRWLSLASQLPDLAEAAPNEFLKAIETSLTRPDAPVTRLLTETGNSVLFGRCWHSGLLWALERLAWAPERLTRVSLILAKLSHIKIKGNWANSPLSSLVDIFRSWFPQTGADIDQRITVLDTLIANEADVAFDLLDRLVHAGPDHASHTARPSWRDDDAGAGYGTTPAEQHKMLVAAADRLIACSKGHPQRIAKLIEKIGILDTERIESALLLADQFTTTGASDEDREIIRSALRGHIHWHRNHDKVRGKTLDAKLRRVEDIYEKLAPADRIVRHRWLFTDGWPKLPARVRDEGYSKRGELVETWRISALRELHSERGMSGIEELATSCAPHTWYIGLALQELGIGIDKLAEWIVVRGGDFTSNEPLTMTLSGLLRTAAQERSTSLIKAILERAKNDHWDRGRVARFLVMAPEQRSTWDFAASCSAEVEDVYWTTVSPTPRLRNDQSDFDYALRRLLDASRPRTALFVCHMDLKRMNSELLAEMLERILKGEEPDGPLLDSYYVGEAVERLEASGEIDKERLVRLEFGLIPALGYEGEQHAKSLYSAILSDPKLFTEILCILYRPANGTDEEIPASESQKTAAQITSQVLYRCRHLPGTQADGTVDPQGLVQFIDDTRQLCREADRLSICDLKLGEILAHAPAGTDGVWPFEPARVILDRPEVEDMRRGFQTGAFNKRGVTTRSPDEGGNQERSLATTYRKYARALQHSHVHLAATLEELARSYESGGVREDLRAKLRQEGY